MENTISLMCDELFLDNANPFSIEEPIFEEPVFEEALFEEPSFEESEFEKTEDNILNFDRETKISVPTEESSVKEKGSINNPIISKDTDKMFDSLGVSTYKNQLKKVQPKKKPIDIENISSNLSKTTIESAKEVKKPSEETKEASNTIYTIIGKEEKSYTEDGTTKDISDNKDFDFVQEEFAKTEYNMDFANTDYSKYTPEEESDGKTTSSVLNPNNQADNTNPEEEPPLVKTKNHDLLQQGFGKFLSFVAMFFIVLGIPVLFAVSERENTINDAGTINYSSIYSVDYQLFNTADSQVEQPSTLSSNRFANVDELTLYLESNTGSILSAEIQTVNKYNAGTIKKDEFILIMQEYINQANEIYHMLLVNKPVYEENGMLEKYDLMYENINTLLIYGDTALVNTYSQSN